MQCAVTPRVPRKGLCHVRNIQQEGTVLVRHENGTNFNLFGRVERSDGLRQPFWTSHTKVLWSSNVTFCLPDSFHRLYNMGRTQCRMASAEELQEIKPVDPDETSTHNVSARIGDNNSTVNGTGRSQRAQRRSRNVDCRTGGEDGLVAADSHDLLQQMVTHQAHTVVALHELTQTMTTIVTAQRHCPESSDTPALLNVDRATVRLDGLEVYAVVSALTLATSIACFDAYGSDFTTTLTSWHELTRTNHLPPLVMNTIFLVVSGVGISAGLHATLVFSLMTMYGRTAVGVSHDAAFVEFFVETGRVRYRGFLTFRLSLYCFLVQVIFTLTSKCSPMLRPLLILINLASMYQVYVDTQSVIEKAGEILFSDKHESGNRNRTFDEEERTANSLRRTLSHGEATQNGNHDPNSILSAVQRSVSAMVGGGVGTRTGVTTRAAAAAAAASQQSASTPVSATARNRPGRRGKTPPRSRSGEDVYDQASPHETESQSARRGGQKKKK